MHCTGSRSMAGERVRWEIPVMRREGGEPDNPPPPLHFLPSHRPETGQAEKKPKTKQNRKANKTSLCMDFGLCASPLRGRVMRPQGSHRDQSGPADEIEGGKSDKNRKLSESLFVFVFSFYSFWHFFYFSCEYPFKRGRLEHRVSQPRTELP